MLEAVIHSIGSDGWCIGRVESAGERNGKTVLVRDVVPGERVGFSIVSEKKRIIFGELQEVISVSAHRVSPPCPYFRQCGGCDLQHIEIDFQRELKLARVRETLEKKWKIAAKQGVFLLGAELPAYHYRNRIQLHITANGELGYKQRGSDTIIAVSSCLISKTILSDAITTLSQLIREHGIRRGKLHLSHNSSDQHIHLSCSGIDPKILPKLEAALTGSGFIFETSGSGTTDLFEQNNQAANSILQSKIQSLFKDESVVELYAGSGNLSLPLVNNGCSVRAVELSPELVRAGRLLHTDRPQLKFICEDAETYIKANPDVENLMLDPPRAGARAALELLSPEHLKKLVYVSCNLNTFCRDAKIIADKGVTLQALWLLDMFPQTGHIETIALFDRSLLTSNQVGKIDTVANRFHKS